MYAVFLIVLKSFSECVLSECVQTKKKKRKIYFHFHFFANNYFFRTASDDNKQGESHWKYLVNEEKPILRRSKAKKKHFQIIKHFLNATHKIFSGKSF